MGPNRVVAMTLLASASALPGIAQAQSASAEQSSAGTQEIIVTAQRREQSVLEVPLSIQASTGEQLAESGIKDLTNLQFTTPGYLPNTSSGFTQIFIRGVGNTLFVGADPSVATFIDDVPRIYGSMAHDLVDVQRIEVLKGAQGGLYGRNATGGVVNIITRKPDPSAFHGEARVSYGERDSFRGTAYLNAPLASWGAVNASVERISHDPYVKNVAVRNPYTAAMFPSGSALFGTAQQTADVFNAAVVPSKLHDQDFWAARGKLLLAPTDNFSLVLAADYYRRSDNNGQGQIGTTPGYTQAVLGAFFNAIGVETALPPGFIYTPTGKFEAADGAPSTVYTREYGLSATADLNVGAFKLTSISAYRNQRTYFLGDSGLVNVPTVIAEVSYPHKRYFYQEFRAVSNFEGPLQVLSGATYLDSQLKGSTQTFFMTTVLPISETAISQTVKNWSAYAQVTYDFTDKLTLAASGRYMHETNNALFTLPIVSPAKVSNKKFVPSATLSYKIPDGTIYARWARGFKTGGVNLLAAPVFFPRPEDGSIFGPETVDTYEAGYRQALFDRKIQLTATVFYNDYKNLQVSARARPEYPALIATVVNAKSARTWGVEGTLNWQVADPLTLSVNAGYLNAKYKDYRYTGSTVIADFDLSGQQMINAPKLQLSFNGALDQPLNDKLRLTGNVLVSHTSRVVYMASSAPGVLPDAVAPGYWLVNLRAGIKTADDRYGIAIVADNLFDEPYYTSGVSTAIGDILTWGDRRVVRAELTAKF